MNLESDKLNWIDAHTLYYHLHQPHRLLSSHTGYCNNWLLSNLVFVEQLTVKGFKVQKKNVQQAKDFKNKVILTWFYKKVMDLFISIIYF